MIKCRFSSLIFFVIEGGGGGGKEGIYLKNKGSCVVYANSMVICTFCRSHWLEVSGTGELSEIRHFEYHHHHSLFFGVNKAFHWKWRLQHAVNTVLCALCGRCRFEKINKKEITA